MTQQPAELMDSLLRLVLIDGNEGVDVVQSVEQKVRIYLILKVIQLRLCLLLLRLLQ